MVGDNILLEPHHFEPALKLKDQLMRFMSDKYTIAIGGESGCGKSTLAIALQEVFSNENISSVILHMDDYFFLPPTSNHNQRLKDISHVGPQEVNLQLLQRHIDQFKEKAPFIEKPLVYYTENSIHREIIEMAVIDVLIIEGTYTLKLDVDFKIFLERDYKATHANRMARARDPLTPFVESVLEIEHHIIKEHKSTANCLIGNNYETIFCL